MSRHFRDVDQIVGARLKAARGILGLSQSEVGAALGVTFQQVQKYEQARNRMSIGAFVEYCEVVDLKPGEVLESLAKTGGRRAPTLQDFTEQGYKAARLVDKFDSARDRRHIVDLLEQIARFVTLRPASERGERVCEEEASTELPAL